MGWLISCPDTQLSWARIPGALPKFHSGWGDETTDRIIWENLTGVISEQAFEKGEGGNRKDMFKEHQEHGTQMGGKEVKR